MEFIINKDMIRGAVMSHYLSDTFLKDAENIDISYVIYNSYFDLISTKREFELKGMTRDMALNALIDKFSYLDKVFEVKSKPLGIRDLTTHYYDIMYSDIMDNQNTEILERIIEEMDNETDVFNYCEGYIGLLTEKVDEKIKLELKKMKKNKELKQLAKRLLELDKHPEKKNQLRDDLMDGLIESLSVELEFGETVLLFGAAKGDMELGKTYPLIIDNSIDEQVFDISLLNYITEETKRFQKVIDVKSAYQYYSLEGTHFEYDPFMIRPSDISYNISDDELPF